MLPPTTTPVPLQQITLGSNTVAYRQLGSGTPLLLLHGWGGSSRYWQLTLRELADQYSVYALDLPGFGESPPMDGPITVERFAAVVRAFAAAQGFERFVLGGHSFGAAVATWIAARHPQQVERLVLTSFGLPRNLAERSFFTKLHHSLELATTLWRPWLTLWRPWLVAAQPLAVMQWSTPPLSQLLASPFLYQPPPSDGALQEGIVDFVGMDPRTAWESSASIGDPKLRAAVRALRVPTLLIHGEDDQIIPISAAQQLTRTVPGLRFVALDACGHVPMAEQSVRYHREVRAFLDA